MKSSLHGYPKLKSRTHWRFFNGFPKWLKPGALVKDMVYGYRMRVTIVGTNFFMWDDVDDPDNAGYTRNPIWREYYLIKELEQ